VSPTEKNYPIPLGFVGDVLRIRIVLDLGQVLDFTVQYEALIDGAHRPVVRYDCHNGPHRDTLDWYGITIDKRFMPEGIGCGQALNDAIDDVEANYGRYRDAFLRRRP
jgi:hypothetical protein